MDSNSTGRYFQLYKELSMIANEIRPYYDVDKVKSYSVYIWTKSNPDADNEDGVYGENVFDIEEDRLVFYVDGHKVVEKAIPIIKKIQQKLKEISAVTGR